MTSLSLLTHCSLPPCLPPSASSAMRFASNVAQGIQRMLNGCTDMDPQQHGLTSDEERAASRLAQVIGCADSTVTKHLPVLAGRTIHMFQAMQQLICFSRRCCSVHHHHISDHITICASAQWPGIQATVVPPNAGLKLFGGAAFERCLNEFQEAAHALKFPSSE